MKDYRFYLIDVDRTLWDFDRNSESAICTLISRHPSLDKAILLGESSDEKNYQHRFFQRYDALNHRLWGDYESGIIDKDKLRWLRFYEAFKLYGIDDEPLSHEFGEEYLRQMICEKELMPGALDMLKRIQATGAKMAVLSNGFKEVQYCKLSRSGISSFFTSVIISEEVGFHKPLPDIFRIALERLCGFTKEDDPSGWASAKAATLMIGDDFENDIEGAQIFGIDQYFYNYKKADYKGATYESESLDGVCSGWL